MSRLQKRNESFLPERFIDLHSYNNYESLFQSSIYLTLVWKTVSELL